MEILYQIWDRVSDTGKESTRPVLLQILKPIEPQLKKMKEEKSAEPNG